MSRTHIPAAISAINDPATLPPITAADTVFCGAMEVGDGEV